MMDIAQERERGMEDWTVGVSVFCNNERVRSLSAVIPGNITSIEKSDNRYDTYTSSGSDDKMERWKSMSSALRESRVLRKLQLEGLTKEAAEALFSGGRNWPLLEELELSGWKLGYSGLKYIIHILYPLQKLDTLDLSSSNLGISAAKMIANVLNHTQIKNLIINGNDIKDKGLEGILSTQNARHLITLGVQNNSFGRRGSEMLSLFLRRDDIQLKKLLVTICSLDGTKMLVQSIPRASKLELITLSWLGSVKAELLNLICNTSNFDSLKNSNHQLIFDTIDRMPYCGYTVRRGEDLQLKKIVEINRQVSEGGSIDCAIHRKLRNVYFENPDFDVQHFNEIDVALMPYLMELVLFAESQSAYLGERYHRHHARRKQQLVPRETIDGIYRLLRNCHTTELFSFPSPESILRGKDEQIHQLEIAVADLKAKNESMAMKLEQLEQENEQLRGACPVPPRKRAKKDDVESRLAALEADVAMLKGAQT